MGAQNKKRRRRHLVQLAAVTAFVVVGVASADTVTPDGDTVTAGNQAVVDLGVVGPGAELTPQTSFLLTCTGKSHPDFGQTLSLTFSLAGSTVPTGGSLSATNASIGSIPPDWPDDTSGGGSTNCPSSPAVPTLADNGNSVVTITAPTTSGTYDYVVRWDFGLAPPDPNPGDDSNAIVGSNTTVTYRLTVSAPVNHAPTANAGGPYGGAEGADVTLSGSGSDSDAGDTIASFKWTYAVATADVGAACAFSSDTAQNPTIACTDDGDFTVSLKVEDSHGLESAASSANLTLTNSDPTATKNFASSVDEGAAFSLELTGGADPGTNDTLTYAFDCGDGSGYGSAGPSASTSCLTTDNGVRSVKAKVIDDDAGFSEYTDSVTVRNVAPTIAISGASNVNEGSQYTLNLGAVTDPGADTVTAYLVHWGDGSSDTYSSGGNKTHVYADGPNTYNITVDLTDEDDTFLDTANALSVTVDNVAPTITSLVTGSAASCGSANSLTINFSDPAGAHDTYSASIDWGDGSTSSPANITAGHVASHTYASAGPHTATVTVSDEDGGTSASMTKSLVVNYNLSTLLQPVNNTGHGENPSIFKYGSTVPLKVEITNCDGSHPNALDVRVFAVKTSAIPPSDGESEAAVANQADAGNQMRFSDPIYIFNWSTKSIADATSTVLVTVKVISTGQTVSALIGLKSK
jgi:PKD domain